jgi:protease-4
MTGPQREEIEAILTSIWGEIGSDIAKTRKLTAEHVASLADRAPLLAAEAQPAGLVDKIGYRDQAQAAARDHAGGGAQLMGFAKYLKAAGRPHASGSQIALIYGTGLISRTDSSTGLLAEGNQFTPRAISRAFAAASRNKDVRAIVFRIDSPGGSATASETIWRDVEEARRAGKPVIVSMPARAGIMSPRPPTRSSPSRRP